MVMTVTYYASNIIRGAQADSKPTPANVPVGTAWFEYDTGAVYINNGSTWQLVSGQTNVVNDIQVYNLSTTFSDYTAYISFYDEFSTYADTTAGDAAWPTNSTANCRVNPTNDNIDFNTQNNSNVAIYHDLTTALVSTTWLLRFRVRFSSVSALAASKMTIGISDNASVNGGSTSQDFIGVKFSNPSGVGAYGSVDTDGATPNGTAVDNSVAITWATATDYFFEIERTSATAYVVRRYSDGTYTTVSDSAAGTCVSTTTGLKAIKIMGSTTANEQFATGIVDEVLYQDGVTSSTLILPVGSSNATGTSQYYAVETTNKGRFESNSEVGPSLKIQLSSTADKEPTGCVIKKHANNTATQVKVQTSTDGSTWVDARKINTSLFTAGSYDYFRFNRPTAPVKYLRILATDAGAVVLAITEIKVLVPTESQINRRHGHKSLDATDATLALNS